MGFKLRASKWPFGYALEIGKTEEEKEKGKRDIERVLLLKLKLCLDGRL